MGKFCGNCGAELPDGAEFCGKCGTRLVNASRQNYEQGNYQQQNIMSQPGYGQQGNYQQGYGQQGGHQPGYGQQGNYQQGYGQQGGYQPGYGQNGMPQQNYQPGYGQNGQYTTASPQKNNMPVIIGIALVAVIVVIVGGIFAVKSLTGKDKESASDIVWEENEIQKNDTEDEKEETEEAFQTEAGLPKTVKDVPDGMRIVQFGAYSVAIPEDYTVDIDNDTMCIDNPDFPDTIDRIIFMCGNQEREDMREDDYDDYKQDFDDIRDETTVEADGYIMHHFLTTQSDGENDYETSIYVIFTDEDVCLAAFQTDGKVNQSMVSEKTLAFDASIVFDQWQEAEGSGQRPSGNGGEPDYSDFDWPYGIADDGDEITSFDDLIGTWKCEIVYYDEGGYDIVEELYLGELSGSEDDVVFYLQAVETRFDEKTTIDYRGQAPMVYEGYCSEGEIYLDGPGFIEGMSAYEYNGSQYYYGSFTSPSGMSGVFSMVRP